MREKAAGAMLLLIKWILEWAFELPIEPVPSRVLDEHSKSFKRRVAWVGKEWLEKSVMGVS